MKNHTLVNDFYLGKDEESLAKYLIPEYFAAGDLANHKKHSISIDYALRFLQNEMHELLHSFINGGFSYRGYFLFPLIKDISNDNIRRAGRLKEIAAFLNGNGYDFSDSARKCGKTMSSKNLAAALSALYIDFSKIKNKNVKPIKKPECGELDMKSYKKSDSEYLMPLKGLKVYANDNLRQLLSGFYLHGSLATKDYIKGWSDVDTLAVVSKETIENPESILELRDKIYRMRHFFYRIDPLQHHGSIVISEYDAENYCQAYFPIQIFGYAKSFFEYDAITEFKARQFQGEALAKLFWFVSYFRKLTAEKSFGLGSYGAKTLLHSITLFPSIYLQAKGILVYKKFSFGIAKKDFSSESWKVIDRASSIRSSWKAFGTVPLIGFYSRINPLLCWRLNSQIMDLFRGAGKINDISIKNLAEGMLRLSEEAWGNAKKYAKGKKLYVF